MTRTITTKVENRVYTKEVEISIEKISNSNFPNCPGCREKYGTGKKCFTHFLAKGVVSYYNDTMTKIKPEYQKDVAFVNRVKESAYLKKYINERPESILFLHGPKSSGKTTLLYKFFDYIEKEQHLDVKFLNLREKLKGNYKDFIRIFFGIDYSRSKADVKEKREYSLFNFFKLSVEVLKGMEGGELDPFEIMKHEFIKLTEKGIKPVIIIDELQAVDHIYMANGKDRQVIIELFNFFVAMTKESHLAHIIIASSDGYFLNTVYTDSKLKKSSKFYNVDYLSKEDVMEWLLNLEKYSKITAYTLTEAEAEKVWDVVGGSMWEIQDILSERFDNSIDEVLALYKEKVRGVIAHYIGTDVKKEKALGLFSKIRIAGVKDFVKAGIEPVQVEGLVRDLVKNNILYFDPVTAVYYPQGCSYEWGIRLYFESLKPPSRKKRKPKK